MRGKCHFHLANFLSVVIETVIETTMVFAALYFITIPTIIYAQGLDAIEVAERYPLSDEGSVEGDIVTLDKENGLYVLSKIVADQNIIGIIVSRPLFLFETNIEKGVPVVRDGRVKVNISDLNGPIGVGDPITSSAIPGKGQLATNEDAYILGFALEPFANEVLENSTTTTSTTATIGGVSVHIGSILVDLAIGAYGEKTVPKLQSAETIFENRGRETRTAIQYLVAALIALGAIFFAFRNFGSSIQNAIVSMGRNPRAKLSIQLSLILHLLIIVVISVSGIFLSMVILRINLF